MSGGTEGSSGADPPSDNTSLRQSFPSNREPGSLERSVGDPASDDNLLPEQFPRDAEPGSFRHSKLSGGPRGPAEAVP